MLVPVRCFTCGYPIARFWDEYKRRVSNGEQPGDVLDSLGIKRYCCRRMFLSTYEYIDEFLIYFRPQEVKEASVKQFREEAETRRRRRKES
ncbi:MAG: DNA-directed RNA polymerase subunit N [Thermoproteota archaeon]|jgi:DNA-directed RNA polymerase subunit N|nr:DNA-directed RNA polymerase subunit N [Thermoproteota archaeon]